MDDTVGKTTNIPNLFIDVVISHVNIIRILKSQLQSIEKTNLIGPYLNCLYHLGLMIGKYNQIHS